MLKNITGAITSVLRKSIFAAALTFSGTAMAGTTQIVAQWVVSDWSGLTGEQIFDVQNVLDDNAKAGNYESDGNDVGGGRVNFYIYVDDARVDAIVNELIALETQKKLPASMRVGVAVYKNSKRSDWDYRPAYPSTLKTFSIM